MKYIFTVALLLVFIGCNKETTTILEPNAVDLSLSFEEQMLQVPNNTLESKEIITAYSEIMKEVLHMAQDQ
ncbi:hypothetical protein [Cellulophaga tyrosinoxydans]|uniref:Uncharacterized protein n=1 Tax=Cellulophaga tyrosinoxydans TaxID=504486 RepID=A0A1W1YH49_9FLAO|nr:hypothetical protein [Cellulophaga tyrosinoxydans]SMC35466.1 hypothetical protein SAMN05660703_0478 [Cellulophaga tyrosinoxydans]